MLEYYQRQPRSGCPRIECASVLPSLNLDLVYLVFGYSLTDALAQM